VNLGDECRNLRSEVGVGLSSFEEIQELLPDQVFEGLLHPEFVFDALGGLAPLDPDFV
jgi:hypothetical protein